MFIEDKLRKEGGHIGVLLIKLQITLALKKLRWEQNSVVISIYKNLPKNASKFKTFISSFIIILNQYFYLQMKFNE